MSSDLLLLESELARDSLLPITNNLINYAEDPDIDNELAYKHVFGEMVEDAITAMNDEMFGELDDISE